jgi:hypothetical protein
LQAAVSAAIPHYPAQCSAFDASGKRRVVGIAKQTAGHRGAGCRLV